MNMQTNRTQNHPLVTIAIPTYNRANGYLRQAIQSALDQTYPHIEILVADNASTDDTERVVRGFQDVRLRYVKRERNIGYLNNWNQCLQEARGDYFVLLCDDDLLDPDHIANCMHTAQYRRDIGLILSGARVIDADGAVLGSNENLAAGAVPAEFFRLFYSGKVVMYLCNSLYNTARLREMGGLDDRCKIMLDVSACSRMGARYGRVDVREVSASLRKHPHTLTRASSIREWCDSALTLLEEVLTLVGDQRETLNRLGRKTSAGWCYDLANEMTSLFGRAHGFTIVLRKFGVAGLPSPRQLARLHPAFRYYYALKSRARHGVKRLLNVSISKGARQ